MLNAFAVTECINNYRIEQQFQQSHKNINHKEKKKKSSWDTAIKFNFLANKDEKEWKKKEPEYGGVVWCTRNSYDQTLR